MGLFLLIAAKFSHQMNWKITGSGSRRSWTLFKSKQRIASAWAKGLMFGKAVGARDERDRIITLIEDWQADIGQYKDLTLTELIRIAIRRHNDWPRKSDWNYAGLLCCFKCKIARNWKETRKDRAMADVVELMGWYSIFMGIALAVIIGFLIKKNNE